MKKRKLRIIRSLKNLLGLKGASRKSIKSTATAEKKKLPKYDIDERLSRLNNEDEIYLGELASQLVFGELGALVAALTNGLADQELKDVSKLTPTEAAVKLGRASAFRAVLSNLELLVVRMRELQSPVDYADAEEESMVSRIPNPKMYRGMTGTV